MIRQSEIRGTRDLHAVRLATDLVVIGGGRAGFRVVLLQDRPVRGGNASSEVRLWILGATSHMGNKNRWARELVILDGARVPVAAGGIASRGDGTTHRERLLCEISANHRARQIVRLDQPVTTGCHEIRLVASAAYVPAVLCEVRCYAAFD